MEYRAISKYLKVSPRKMRILARELRGKNVTVALAALTAMHEHSARLMSPVISSALANAKAKNAGVGELMIKTIDVSEGPVAKRFHAVSRGMAHPYKKRSTHVTIILSEKEAKALPKAKGVKKE